MIYPPQKKACSMAALNYQRVSRAYVDWLITDDPSCLGFWGFESTETEPSHHQSESILPSGKRLQFAMENHHL